MVQHTRAISRSLLPEVPKLLLLYSLFLLLWTFYHRRPDWRSISRSTDKSEINRFCMDMDKFNSGQHPLPRSTNRSHRQTKG
jgi:hypothetical protein